MRVGDRETLETLIDSEGRLSRPGASERAGQVALATAQELRTPIFGISSAAQLLRLRGADDPIVEKHAARILREVERLNRVVAELLQYGRARRAVRAAGNPDDVWDRVLAADAELLERHRLTVERRRVEPPVRCQLDEEELAQGLRNLLAHIAGVAPPGSAIAIVSDETASGAWRVQVRYGALPIPAELLPRVWDIFYAPKPGSFGVGLALAQRAVEEHGGTITLDSSPARGTSVTIVLPPARTG